MDAPLQVLLGPRIVADILKRSGDLMPRAEIERIERHGTSSTRGGSRVFVKSPE
jgi:hypothetical protein